MIARSMAIQRTLLAREQCAAIALAEACVQRRKARAAAIQFQQFAAVTLR